MPVFSVATAVSVSFFSVLLHEAKAKRPAPSNRKIDLFIVIKVLVLVMNWFLYGKKQQMAKIIVFSGCQAGSFNTVFYFSVWNGVCWPVSFTSQKGCVTNAEMFGHLGPAAAFGIKRTSGFAGSTMFGFGLVPSLR